MGGGISRQRHSDFLVRRTIESREWRDGQCAAGVLFGHNGQPLGVLQEDEHRTSQYNTPAIDFITLPTKSITRERENLP